MRVEFQDSFIAKLNRQVQYISADKPAAARKFKNDLLLKCKNLSEHPFKFKNSIYFDRDDIRDLTFKGYTVVYKVQTEQITVFALIKHEEKV